MSKFVTAQLGILSSLFIEIGFSLIKYFILGLVIYKLYMRLGAILEENRKISNYLKNINNMLLEDEED